MIPLLIQAIYAEHTDAVTKMAKLAVAAKRMGVELIFNTDMASPEYGKLLDTRKSGTADGKKRFG